MCGSLISSIAYVMIFYFSGTGNSRWVAEQLSTAGAEELVAIADVYASDRRFVLRPDEKVGFVFPVYSWGPPSIVLQLIASVQFSEKPAYLYFVCTCGDDTGKTAEIFCKAVGRRGWKCQAGFSVIMPNTYVCLPGFDIDWRDVAETKCQEAEVRVAEIARLVAERVQRMDCYPGRFPALKSYLLRPLFNRFWSSPRRSAWKTPVSLAAGVSRCVLCTTSGWLTVNRYGGRSVWLVWLATIIVPSMPSRMASIPVARDSIRFRSGNSPKVRPC